MSGIVLAVWTLGALLWPMPRPLRLYLLAQAVYIPVIWGTDYLFGPGQVYRLVYCVFTLAILLSIVNIVRDALQPYTYRWRAAALASLVAIQISHGVYMQVGRPVSVDDRIVLAEGCVLTWAGLLVGFTAKYADEKGVPLILSGLWLSQALFDVGWVLHWPMWQQSVVNWNVPAAIEIVAFILLTARLRALALRRPPPTPQPALPR